MKSLFARFILPVTGIVMAGLLFVACNKSDNAGISNMPVSGLMAFNLSPDKAVGVTLSGNSLLNQPLSFGSYTGSYLNVYPGNRLVESVDYASGNALDSSSYNFEPNKYYSLFVTGNSGNYRNVIVRDNFDSLSISSGQAYVRYVNAIPDSSAPNLSIVANGENVINSNASFGSVSDFKAVTPGDVTIQVNNGSTINKSRTINIEQQKAYTVLVAGITGSTGNDSLQIRFIENGTLQQKAQKASSASSANTN